MTTEELQGGAGVVSIFESTFEIGTGRGASRGIVSDRTDDSVEGERSEAVQAARPISGDTVRTSFPEGKVSEEGSLHIT